MVNFALKVMYVMRGFSSRKIRPGAHRCTFCREKTIWHSGNASGAVTGGAGSTPTAPRRSESKRVFAVFGKTPPGRPPSYFFYECSASGGKMTPPFASTQ